MDKPSPFKHDAFEEDPKVKKVVMTDGFKEDLDRLFGPGSDRAWQKNTWDWIKTYYWATIPYDWRPGQIWYRFTCWGWKRYTTVHPRTIPGHGWVDRDVLMAHCMFELLVRFVDEEKPVEHFDLIDTPHKELWGKLFSTYNWWKGVYLPHWEQLQTGIVDFDSKEAMDTELQKRCHDLVDVMPLMWT